MKQIVVAAILCLMLAWGCGPGTQSTGDTDSGITHGPVLGRLGHNHVGVWARTSQAGEFKVFYGTAADALTMTATGTTMLGDDNTGWTMLEGLEPNTKYFYEIGTGSAAAGVEERSGSFHTLPDPSALKTEHNPEGHFNFRFRVCLREQPERQRQPDRQGADHARHHAARVDERHRQECLWTSRSSMAIGSMRMTRAATQRSSGASRPSTAEADTPREVQLMPSIVGVWENYKNFYNNGANLRAWHRNVPSYYTFDDHELLNDVYGAGEPGRRNRRAVFRDVGTRAWYDYLGWSNPVPETPGIVYGQAQLEAGSDVLTDPDADFTGLEAEATLLVHWGTPDWGVMLLGQNPDGTDADDEGGDPNSKVYEVVEVIGCQPLAHPASCGRGWPAGVFDRAALLLQQARFERRVSLLGHSVLPHDARHQRPREDRSHHAGRAAKGLGEADDAGLRCRFLLHRLLGEFLNLACRRHRVANISETNKDDAWTAFLWEREDMINFWDELGKPVFVLTGDLHNSFAIKLTDRVWEFRLRPAQFHQSPATLGRQPPEVGHVRLVWARERDSLVELYRQ